MNPNEEEAQMRKMSRRSFLWGAAAVGASFGGLRWLNTRPTEDGAIWPLRRVLQTNEEVARTLFSANRLAPTFPKARITEQRVNGAIGLDENFDPKNWKLHVEGLASGAAVLSLGDIKALPKIEMTTELKCIEGWSVITSWAGARLSDFARKYLPAARGDGFPEYVGLSTPDKNYYVGLDRQSALHPQTLLCYEMNGAPLTLEHGAPLRLVIPVKYGIKHLKRIGTLKFTDERPADYWAEQGYDWYAGH